MEVPGLNAKQKAEKRVSQRERILAMLQLARESGVNSEELNRVAFRYSAVIFNLRHEDGWLIDTIPRTGTELARFVLKGKAGPSQQLPLL